MRYIVIVPDGPVEWIVSFSSDDKAAALREFMDEVRHGEAFLLDTETGSIL